MMFSLVGYIVIRKAHVVEFRRLLLQPYLLVELLAKRQHGTSADGGNSIRGSRELGDAAGYGGY
jgi:hypothetical protein